MNNTQNPPRPPDDGRVEIVRITPTILEKGLFWFEHNNTNIRKEAKKISSFWNKNYFEIQQLQLFPMSNLMRQLSDWGYIKAQEISIPGQYVNRGGILDIFPINSKNAYRLEYEGNMVLSIKILEGVFVKDTKSKLKNLVVKTPQIYSKDFTRKHEKAKKLLDSLQVGTYAVHIDHGIGRFVGIDNDKFQISNFKSNPNEQISNDEKKDGYLILEYAQGDKLLVPLNVAEKVTPYVGFGEPKLTRLGGNIWERTKRKVKEDIIKTARELAQIYAKRELSKRKRYDIDFHLETELEKTFPYQETPDQLQALKDIQSDFKKETPMDRIICADVGFGKTEIALRAALYAVGAGYQVVIVAPTTILAYQHYKTFKNRLDTINYPINVAKLTRMEKRSEQKNVLGKLQNGKIDIVIGTHRLLQKDVHFKNLGLLILDEEQRFGVKQKEFFKNKRAQLDVLSLSATPIPRTLSFALGGLRDISVIHTPPHGRIPIKTYVAKMEKNIILEAVERELKRGGQVYFLHNRIGSLQKTVLELKKLLPKAKIEFLHAKLPEYEIIEKMERFENRQIDVLVTTTIMENGLDFQNANTLIVDNATLLGLAQAHQIRGRIGRSDKQAYAYFLYPSRKLPHKSRQRLSALKEADYLGAGYQLALRDLEIRGAGSFLGREQSGNVAKIGFNLYCQMLNEAIEELRSS